MFMDLRTGNPAQRCRSLEKFPSIQKLLKINYGVSKAVKLAFYMLKRVNRLDIRDPTLKICVHGRISKIRPSKNETEKRPKSFPLSLIEGFVNTLFHV